MTPEQRLAALVEANCKKEGKADATLFRPSAASRWMTCVGSTQLCLRVPSGGGSSSAAREGTAAHKVAEEALRKTQLPEEWADRHIYVDGDPAGVYVDAEMVEKVQVYLDEAEKWRGPAVAEFVEARVSLSSVAPDDPFLQQVGGTADHILVDYEEGRIVNRDLKYGKGVIVIAGESKQQKIYLLCELLSFSAPSGGWKQLVAEVVQPRLPREEDWVTHGVYTPADLMAFLGEVYTAIRAAVEPDPPLTPGEHCWQTFCPAREICPALASKSLEIMQDRFAAYPLEGAVTLDQPVPAAPDFAAKLPVPVVGKDLNTIVLPNPTDSSISAEDLARWLKGRDFVDAWFSAIEQRAVRILESGGQIPGYKLVERTTHRRWVDPDAAAVTLIQAGANPESILLQQPLMLISPKQVEDRLKSKAFKQMVEKLTVRPKGGATLVEASDKRPSITVPLLPAIDGEP